MSTEYSMAVLKFSAHDKWDAGQNADYEGNCGGNERYRDSMSNVCNPVEREQQQQIASS
ncbi:hypothetical protein [Novipirellula sp.]|uniref:hypothetical protein n=1 Tax=Novipirellula sp. TaxID=2795430 RepID=UPI00356383EB